MPVQLKGNVASKRRVLEQVLCSNSIVGLYCGDGVRVIAHARPRSVKFFGIARLHCTLCLHQAAITDLIFKHLAHTG
jgi:hypothetical protein